MFGSGRGLAGLSAGHEAAWRWGVGEEGDEEGHEEGHEEGREQGCEQGRGGAEDAAVGPAVRAANARGGG